MSDIFQKRFYQRLLNQLHRFFLKNKRMPSFSELVDLWGYNSKGSVSFIINRMVEKGLIKKDQKGKLLPLDSWFQLPYLRSLHILKKFLDNKDLSSSLDLDIEYKSLNQITCKNPNTTFIYKVKDNKLENIGISKGDFVLIDTFLKPVIDDIVVFLKQEKAFLGKLIKQESKICIQSASIECPDKIDIIGVVVSIIKTLR